MDEETVELVEWIELDIREGEGTRLLLVSGTELEVDSIVIQMGIAQGQLKTGGSYAVRLSAVIGMVALHQPDE